MKKFTWEEIKDFILEIISNIQSRLDEYSIAAVQHYDECDEYEMAFEGLFLEVMKLKEVPEIDLAKSAEIGTLLKLHEESVFDFYFWNKFQDYLDMEKN